MVNVSGSILFSPSAVGTYADCPERFWHERHDDGTGLLPTDGIAAAASSAFHDALMMFHRQSEAWYAAGQKPPPATARAHLDGLVRKALLRQQVDPSIPGIAERLAKARPGLDALAERIIDEMPTWAQYGDELLVWAENKLDHGPDIRAVLLEPGVLMPTRPDIIGIRRHGNGLYRAVVRDYKAKRDAVNPAFDDGILLRGFWALAEIIEPRCRWFLAGRDVDVDTTAVDLETVNIMHFGTADFVLRHTMTDRALFEHRDRLVATCRDMAAVDAAEAADVMANPGGLCHLWCAYLHRCAAGRAFVRKYVGDEALAERLVELP